VEGHEAFTYQTLLDRIVSIIKEKKGVNFEESDTIRLTEPKCARTKTKSTWINFGA
jgi:hypothetical protein